MKPFGVRENAWLNPVCWVIVWVEEILHVQNSMRQKPRCHPLAIVFFPQKKDLVKVAIGEMQVYGQVLPVKMTTRLLPIAIENFQIFL